MAPSLLETIQNTVAVSLVGLPDAVVALLAGRPEVRDGQTLDPQLQLLLRLMGLAGLPPLETLSAAQAREVFNASAGLLAPGPRDMLRLLNRKVPGPDGDVPIRVYVPRTGKSPHPVLVYYHGGGWTVGNLDTHDAVLRVLAHESECVVVAVDYRMGPEHRYPAAAQDALAAFDWVAQHATEIGGDPKRLGVGGDSAGGNLAAVVAQQTLAAGRRGPDFQLLIYPATNLSGETQSTELLADGFYLTRSLMRWFIANYVSSTEDRLEPRCSPLLAPDLAGQPPAFVVTAGYDPLRDEGKAYAERLLDAGVDVEYRNYGSLIHGFFSMIGVVREARRAFNDMVAALRVGLGVDS